MKIKPEQVPERAAKAAREAMLAGWSDVHQIIAAAINAWPGMQRRYHIEQAIILPLPQENTDDR